MSTVEVNVRWYFQTTMGFVQRQFEFNLSSSFKYKGRFTEKDNISRTKALNLHSSSLTTHDLEDLQSSDPQSVLLNNVKDNEQRNGSQSGAQFPSIDARHSSMTDFVRSYGNKPLVTLGLHGANRKYLYCCRWHFCIKSVIPRHVLANSHIRSHALGNHFSFVKGIQSSQKAFRWCGNITCDSLKMLGINV